MEKSTTERRSGHEALAVVLQVRDAELQVLLWERAQEPFARAWALPGGLLGARETLEALDPPPPRGQGGRARARPPRAARDAERPGRDPARPADRDRLPRARPGATSTRSARGHRVASGRTSSPRRPSTTARSRWRAASGCARSSRTRTSASRSRRRASPSPSSAASTARRSATTSPPRTSSACCVRRRLLEPTGETAPARARRRSPRGRLPLRRLRPAGHRPVRRAAPAAASAARTSGR